MKNLLLFGFILVLLLTIPVTLYLVRNQTTSRSNASPASQLSFIPSTKTVSVGDNFVLDINLNPGQGASANSVAFVDLQITFPNTLALQKTAENNNTGIKLGQVNGSNIIALTNPTTTCATQTCTMKVSLGMPPSNTVQTQQPIATMYFTAVTATDPNSNGAEISFSGSKALSIANGDKPTDNILAGAQSAIITILAQGALTPTATPGGPTNTPGGPTNTPSAPTPTQTTSGGGTSGTTSTPTQTTSGGGTSGAAPICTALSADTTSAASAPAAINFTAAGNSSTSTIAKVTFNFGDGSVQDVTTGGGIGTNAVSVPLAHSYNQAGTFTASAALTDASGGISNPTSCSQTITIGQTGSSGGSGTTNANTPTPTKVPSIPSTGPGETIMTVGLVGAAIMMVGGLFLFGI